MTAAADAALYSAKQRGGAVAELARSHGPIQGRTPGAPDPADRPLAEAPSPREPATLAARVRQALDDDRLLIYGQPAISLQTGDIAHRELLVRMRDESGEVLAASEFLAAAAQEPGLCADIDRWVVDRALAMLANGSRRARLQVNLSGETLADDDARGRLAATIAASEASDRRPGPRGRGGVDPAKRRGGHPGRRGASPPPAVRWCSTGSRPGSARSSTCSSFRSTR